MDNTIGGIITARRQKLGISKSELAKLCGLTPSSITYYEQGERSPSIPSMYKICSALGLSIDDLVNNQISGYEHVALIINKLKELDWKKKVRVRFDARSFKIDSIVEAEEIIILLEEDEDYE